MSCCQNCKQEPRHQSLHHLSKKCTEQNSGAIVASANCEMASKAVDRKHLHERPECAFRQNRGHGERECEIKKQAKRGRVGCATGKGFASASGLKNVGTTG